MLYKRPRKQGRIPTAQVDHVYLAVKNHVLGSSKQTRKQKPPGDKRKKNKKSKRARRRYVYGRTQDMFKSNPGQLAKYARE
jgi:hypothetical protein